MAYRSTSTVVEDNSPSASAATLTVQTGVVATDYCYVVIAGSANASNETTTTVTLTKSGITFTQWLTCGATADNNQWWHIYECTGLVATDTISAQTNQDRATSFWIVAHTVQLGVPGSVYKRAGSSLTTTVAPSMSCAAGQVITSFGIERNTTGGTTISSQSNSNGRSVTADFYAKASATGGQVSLSVMSFTETTQTTGTLTRTYTVASGNGASVLAPILSQTGPPIPRSRHRGLALRP